MRKTMPSIALALMIFSSGMSLFTGNVLWMAVVLGFLFLWLLAIIWLA